MAFWTRRGRALFGQVGDVARQLESAGVDEGVINRMYEEVDMIVSFAGADDHDIEEEEEHALCDTVDLILGTKLHAYIDLPRQQQFCSPS